MNQLKKIFVNNDSSLVTISAGNPIADPQAKWEYGTSEDLINQKFAVKEAEIDDKIEEQDEAISGYDQRINLLQNDMIELGDKAYDASTYSGLGRKLLKKKASGVNTLYQEDINEPNTIYVIQYDYVLGENITVPDNCVLEFDGGSISAGTGENKDTVTFDNTILRNCDYYCLKNISFDGTLKNTKINVDCVYVDDIGAAINKLIPIVGTIILSSNKKYIQTTTININLNNKTIIGQGFDKIVEQGGYQQAATEIWLTSDVHSVYVTRNNAKIENICFIATGNNYHAGILKEASTYLTVYNCKFSGFGVGIHLSSGFGDTIKNNKIYSSSRGIAITWSIITGVVYTGCVIEGNHIEFVDSAIFMESAYNVHFIHNGFEVVHPDFYKPITYWSRFGTAQDKCISLYLCTNIYFDSTYVEGANQFIYINGSCKAITLINTFFNSHVGETYVKPFTRNFFGYAKFITIDGFYFANVVNETAALQSKDNGVIVAEQDCEIKNCRLSYIYVPQDEGNNVIIGQNIYETTRYGGVVDFSGKTIILPYFRSKTGITADRPSGDDLPIGIQYYDNTLKKPIWHKGNNIWIDATGIEV